MTTLRQGSAFEPSKGGRCDFHGVPDARHDGPVAHPTFLVIGAQRSGTTWLAAMLRSHPDVYVSPTKEIHFFDRTAAYAEGIDWYTRHFDGRTTEQAVGECTPDYLWVCDGPPSLNAERRRAGESEIDFVRLSGRNYDIPGLVHQHYPDLQLVVTLRNPVDRAISSFFHHIRMRRISPRSTIREVGGRYGILGEGFYHASLLQWFEHFPPERFLVLLFEEDVVANPQEGLARVFDHVGVERVATAEPGTKYNERASDAFLYARYYAPRLARHAFAAVPSLHRLPRPRVEVTDDDRRWLEELYRTESERLEELLGRSLDAWRTSSSLRRTT